MSVEKGKFFQYNKWHIGEQVKRGRLVFAKYDKRSDMVRIAIVDDDTGFAQKVEARIKNFFEKKQEPVYTWLPSSRELLQKMKNQNNFDIYLFDVEMPSMSGIELGEKVHELDPYGKIIFLTAHGKYALQGIRLGIYYYILKKSWWTELSQILERICKETEESKEEFAVLTDEGVNCRLLVNDILFLTKDGKYTVYHCLNRYDREGQNQYREYRDRIALEDAHARLPQDRFIVVIKGIIVNLKHVIRTEKLEVFMRDGSKFPISRFRKDLVRNQMAEYWGEN